MRKHHPENERTKRRYVEYLKDARQLSDTSIDQTVAAIADFETATRWRDFRKFRIELAQKYKRDLGERSNPKTGKKLAKATISSRLMALKGFFEWLAGQPGFRSKLTYSDAEYFRPSANDERIAKAVREKPVASVEKIRQVLDAMPAATDIERRDRALIAFTLLSGARDNAIASISIKHVDLDRRTVFQDAREVRTKNRKTFTTWFFPVGADIEKIVADWIAFLTKERGFRLDDPLFPATKVALGDNGFEAAGLDRKHWKNAAAIRRIFKDAFASADLPYANPHSFRNTLALLGERLCFTPEDFKAWSQNLGHEHVLTTFTSYGAVASHRQAEIFNQLRDRQERGRADDVQGLDDEAVLALLATHLRSKAA
ncbi:tyrosine-type recombinase/integrase [Mesorhizobium denitrificans]|uniref:Site-specific integrase n=1 Tax=Mesorhizobium denitrificans TaxID=2294114 RepID=A0A371XJ15_9HYPH|nr:tyrosine-type recombinase/integrase [Mesorhizobium denitrificans]RFC69228.1 site-specific integrase [Mesorhizobium denitrificans]